MKKQIEQQLTQLAELIVQTRLCEYEVKKGEQKSAIDCLLEEVADKMHDMGLFDDVYRDWFEHCFSDARKFFENKPQRIAEMVGYLLDDLNDLENNVEFFAKYSTWAELFSNEADGVLLKKLIIALGNFSKAKTLDLESFDSHLSLKLMKLVEKCDAVL